NFGYSAAYKVPIARVISPRVQNTAVLVSAGLLAGLVATALLTVVRPRRGRAVLSATVTTVSVLGSSLTVPLLGLLLIIWFAVSLHWIPPGGLMSADAGPGLLDVI